MYLNFCGLSFQDEVLDYDAFAFAKERGEFPFDQVWLQLGYACRLKQK
jgi:hypothetical protein